jgi:hypothetical protein
MFPACVYAGQIIAVFAVVIVAIWGATHWAAAALGYQAALGPTWFAKSGDSADQARQCYGAALGERKGNCRGPPIQAEGHFSRRAARRRLSAA